MVNKRNKIIYKCVITLILLMITVASIAPFIYLAVTAFVSDMSLVFKNGIALKNHFVYYYFGIAFCDGGVWCANV